MSSILQVVAGLAIIFFLPGFMLINMMFPRRGELDPEYDLIYRCALGMGTSVVIAILAGFALNAISTEEQGYVTAGPLWTVLISLTGVFAILGWFRGAYPRLGYIHPVLYRVPTHKGEPRTIGNDFAKKRRLESLVIERERLLKDVEKYTERSATSNPQRKLYYRKVAENTRERISEVNDELKKLGREAR
ncbi:MAG: hypothetical protein A3K75_00135 [Euryarchaeota archaeon RBG_13_61_15]|nr:MAG: hypothetical protein A3K75_00135 [Euryarchaeota archaeon RBG_13_61_15]